MSHSTESGGASHGSVKTYMTGFILSVILTVIPFWMVMTGAASPVDYSGIYPGNGSGADFGASGVFPAHEHQI